MSSSEVQRAPRKRRRYSCLRCRERRVKCDGDMPCGACLRSNSCCAYEDEAQEHGTKRIYTVAECAPLARLKFNAESFGSKEVLFIRLYHTYWHSFTPIGLNPVILESFGVPSTHGDKAKMHAAKAATWAAAAMGAAMLSDPAAVDMYEKAIEHLRECFDAPYEEVVRAYLAVSNAACCLGDAAHEFRYICFANVLSKQIEADDISEECQICVYYLSCEVPRMTSNVLIPEGIREEFDVMRVERMPWNLQLLYVLGFASQKVDEILAKTCTNMQERTEECGRVLKFLRPVAKRLGELPRDESNAIAQFFCLALLAYYAANSGSMAETALATSSIIQLLSTDPQLIAMRPVSNVAQIIVGFLHKLGAHEEAAWLEHQIAARPCYSPLQDRGIVDCENLIRDYERALESDSELSSASRHFSLIPGAALDDDSSGFTSTQSSAQSPAYSLNDNDLMSDTELLMLEHLADAEGVSHFENIMP